MEQLFDDVRRELTALRVLLPASMVATCYAVALTEGQLRQRVHTLLGGVWTERWRKAVNAKRRRKVKKAKQSGAHTSLHRLLESCRQQHSAATIQT